MKEIMIKKCNQCGAEVKVIKDCTCSDCGITCCNEPMQEVKCNSVDAAVEKHIPTYEIKEDKIEVSVNHVMEEDHYIEWIGYVTNKKEMYVYFTSKDTPKATFPYEGEGILYSSCNKHGLWKTNID